MERGKGGAGGRGGGGRGLGASCLFVPPPLKRTMFQSHVYLCPSETVFFSHAFRPLLLLLLAHARIALSSQKPSSRESCWSSGSFCRNRGEEEKGEFLSLSFFLLPHLHCHLRPLFSLFRKRRSKTYGPCFVFHAVIGMLTNQWGPKSSGLTDPKCFSLSFSFFFATSASLSSSSFPSFPFPLLARGKRQRHPHKKKPKTKQSAMMIKRQITQRTRVSDSVRPHRRR